MSWKESRGGGRAVIGCRRHQHIQGAAGMYLNTWWDCVIMASALSAAALSDEGLLHAFGGDFCIGPPDWDRY